MPFDQFHLYDPLQLAFWSTLRIFGRWFGRKGFRFGGGAKTDGVRETGRSGVVEKCLQSALGLVLQLGILPGLQNHSKPCSTVPFAYS